MNELQRDPRAEPTNRPQAELTSRGVEFPVVVDTVGLGRDTCLLWPELITPKIGLILASYVRAWSPGEEWVTERNWGGGCAWCPAQTPHPCQLPHPHLGCPPTLPTAFWPGCPSGSRADESSDAPPNYLGA